MILAKLSAWKSINGLEHIATTWEIASDIEFKNVLETVENSKSMMMTLYSSIEVPVNTIYYIRAKRHYSNMSVGYWCKPIEVTNHYKKVTNLLYQKEIHIETPYVYVKQEEILNNETLTINTSQFECDNDKHYCTSYFIYDENNKLIYSKLMDSKNLTSITIENKSIYKQNKQLKFAVIFKGESGIESKAGLKTIKLDRTINYKILTNLLNVKEETDLTINIDVIDDTRPLNIHSVHLYDNTYAELIKLTKAEDGTYLIPGKYLKLANKYKLLIKSNNTQNNSIITTYYDIIVNDKTVNIITLPNYVYSDKLTRWVNEDINAFIPEGIITQSFNGKILVPNVTNETLDILEISLNNNEYSIKNTNKVTSGIILPSVNIQDMFIKNVNNNILLIDMLNLRGNPTFYVYKYNVESDTFVYKHHIERPKEYATTGKCVNLLQISETKFLYIPYNTNHLMEYDIENNTINKLQIETLVDSQRSLLVRSRSNRIFLCNGSNYSAAMYNHSNCSYTTGYIYGPDSFINSYSKAIPLYNGNTLICKWTTEGIYKDEGNMQVFHYKNSTMTLPGLSFEDKLPSSIILNQSGEIFFVNTMEVTDESNEETGTAQVQLFRTYK